MEKPTTISATEKLLSELINDRMRFINLNIEVPVNEFRKAQLKKNELEISSYNDKITEVKKHLIFLKNSKKKPHLFSDALIKWVKNVYGVGINFGYKGLSLRYVHPQNLFIIVTSNGSVGGTGTAMGTAGYYYAPSTHFVVFPQFGGYRGDLLPDGRRINALFEKDGRLTNELKQYLIDKGEEYAKEHNIQPFVIA